MNMSLQKINKKAFKSPFNNPRKHSPSDPERKISFQEHEARIQCQVMVRLFYSLPSSLPLASVSWQLETS
jgi:hypothetical protein